GLHEEVVDDAGRVRHEIDHQLDRLPEELLEVQIVEVGGSELAEIFGRAVERLEHLDRRHAAGERGGEERSGGQADVDVEVRRLPIHHEVVERLQASQLVGATRDG